MLLRITGIITMKMSEKRAHYLKKQEKLGRKREREYQKKEELAALTKCTMCGKQFSILDVQDGWIYSDHKGYGSKYDETIIKFNLCADCMDKVIDFVRGNSINPVYMKDYDAFKGVYHHFFLGGSQTINELPEGVRETIDKYLNGNSFFLVGDCKGADVLFQQYLKGKNYRRVKVYVSGDKVRNNVGDYETVHINAPDKEKDPVRFYKVKDYAMADVADSAIMIWDGKSAGTFLDIVDMAAMHKPTELFIKDCPGKIVIEKTEHIVTLLNEMKAEKRLYELLEQY